MTDNPDSQRAADPTQEHVPCCPNPLCGYGAPLGADQYCPTCCLTPREVWRGQPCPHRLTGAACQGCYADRLEDHVGQWLPELETRDGDQRVVGGRVGTVHTDLRSGGQLFVPLDIVAGPDGSGPPWEWPDGRCGHGTGAGQRCSSCAQDIIDGQHPPMPGPDPDREDGEVDDSLWRIERAVDALHGEVQDGLGTGLKDPAGSRLPSELESIHCTLLRLECLLDRGLWSEFTLWLTRFAALAVGLAVLAGALLVIAVMAGLLPLMLP